MIRVGECPVFGKIYQIRYRDRAMLRRLYGMTMIQTYGMRIGKSITCTSEEELVEALRSLVRSQKDIVILSPSTLVIDGSVYRMFRLLNSVGISLFLFVLQDNPVWYADEVLHP